MRKTVIGRGHNCSICGMPLRSGNPQICAYCSDPDKKKSNTRRILEKILERKKEEVE